MAETFSLWSAVKQAIFDCMDRPVNRKQPLTVTRVTYSAISRHELQIMFFHLFDLLGLDEDLVPPRLRKRLGGLLCNPKVEKQD